MSFDLRAHLARAQDFSARTFGPGWRAGVLDHILKEVEEVRKDPTDLEEWTDIVILGFDGLWRSSTEDAPDIASNYGDFPHFSRLPEQTTDRLLAKIIEVVGSLRYHHDLPLSWMMIVDLATDGMRVVGATDQQIIDNLVAKQTKNEGRKWPDWRTMPTDKAIEHVREAAE